MEPFTGVEVQNPNRIQTTRKNAENIESAKLHSKFIRLVYFIQLARMLIIFGAGYLIYKNKDARNFVIKNPQIEVFACMISVFLVFVVICIPDLMFTKPYNYIAMSTIVLDEVLIYMVIVRYFPYLEVILSFGVCCGFVLLLFILSMQFLLHPTLKVKLAFLIIYLIISAAIIAYILEITLKLISICMLCPFLLGAYVVYDTNLMATGQHQFEYSDNDYLPGSFDIILDSIRFILQLIVAFIEFFISKI